MHQLKFNDNPNGKLFPDVFGDIRQTDYNKFTIGNLLEVHLRKYELGIVEVVGYKEFSLKKITDTMAVLNSGKSAPQQARQLQIYYGHFTKLTEDSTLMHVVFKWKKRNLQTQATLLTEWWKTKEEEQPNYSNQKTLFS